MSRSQFTFYESYMTAAKRMSQDERRALYEAIIEYSLTGTTDVVLTTTAQQCVMDIVKPFSNTAAKNSENAKKKAQEEQKPVKKPRSKKEAASIVSKVMANQEEIDEDLPFM